MDAGYNHIDLEYDSSIHLSDFDRNKDGYSPWSEEIRHVHYWIHGEYANTGRY